MCLLAFALDSHPAYRLVLAANRDEFHARPASSAGWWQDAPHVLGGRDLTAGGTWLAVTREGRWAALTNLRDGRRPPDPGAPSRGALVAEYVRGRCGAAAYLKVLSAEAGRWNGFNLVCGDLDSAWWLSNRASGPLRLEPGIHALSNALPGTPWPKVERIRGDLAAALEGPDGAMEQHLFDALARRDPAPDADLPDTGVGLEAERGLSSAFIDLPGYGTRATTLLRIGADGTASLVERSWRPGHREPLERRFEFRVSASPATS